MPQMAPLLWLYLFFFFSISLVFFLILNYFIKPFTTKSLISSHRVSTTNPWKL